MLSFEVNAPRVVDQKYVLVELLGLGAMGEVWIAHHAGLEQPCAVKLIALEQHEDAEVALVRFAREARIAAALSRKTRHIVSVTDYGADANGPYLVMELLEGEALERRIVSGITEPVASEIVSQIAKGLTVAHGDGVIHRDLKPANVFLTHTEEGELLVKLLDFGIARMMMPHVRPLTVNGVVVGSPGYMSPENVFGEALDTRADVWSLAVVAYEMLTRALPFGEGSVDETFERIRAFAPRPLRNAMPSASPELEAVFERAFAPNIADRFQTARDFAEAFAGACSARAPLVSGVETRRAPLVQRMSRSRIALIAASCFVAIALAVFFCTRSPAPVVSAKTNAPMVAIAPPALVDETPLAPEPSAVPAPPPPTRMQPPRPNPKPVIDPSSIF